MLPRLVANLPRRRFSSAAATPTFFEAKYQNFFRFGSTLMLGQWGAWVAMTVSTLDHIAGAPLWTQAMTGVSFLGSTLGVVALPLFARCTIHSMAFDQPGSKVQVWTHSMFGGRGKLLDVPLSDLALVRVRVRHAARGLLCACAVLCGGI